MMSGGPIRKFKSGWAVALFAGRRAHHFVRYEIGFAVSACGRTEVPKALRGPGSFARCKTCERLVAGALRKASRL
jgi:hypothetical protein